MYTTQRRCLSAVAGIALTLVLSSVLVNPAIAATDLTVTNVSAPSTASLGSTIKVVHVTMNISNTPCASSSSKFYLCTNNFAYANGLRNTQAVPPLSGGGSFQETNTQFIIPSNAKLGTNYIIVICGFGIVDSNWSNNTNNTTRINITP
jgi:hypothetical protein